MIIRTTAAIADGSVPLVARAPRPCRSKNDCTGEAPVPAKSKAQLAESVFATAIKSLIACLVFSAIAVAAPVKDKVADFYTPVDLSQTHLNGLLGERMNLCIEKRLLHVDEKG